MSSTWQDAEPLAVFLREMENEQRDSLATKKEDRKREIHSRIFKLGWTMEDTKMQENGACKKWNTLVCAAKPLTERNWRNILPQLTELLEHNRELRLSEEARIRQHQRNSQARHWIESCLKQLPAYAWAIEPASFAAERSADSAPTGFDSASSVVLAVNAPHINDANKERTLAWPTPSASLVFSWAPFKVLLKTDKLHKDFAVALEELRPIFMSLLLEWRIQTEQTLTSLLPPDPSSSQEAGTIEALENISGLPVMAIPQLDILVDSRPIQSVSFDIQRLFRADTIFTRYMSLGFYPEDMQTGYTSERNSWSYDKEKSDIAKLLLISLGRPNATYLEMKATGRSFTCGQCCACGYASWRELACLLALQTCRKTVLTSFYIPDNPLF
ncbi:hypothetical protein RhiJN_05856 [Ceratobasidium sp. AG-Ba]|nr:hypothetical protein RhiJN_05856 [Ceratobasidium sp. AG-Ba]